MRDATPDAGHVELRLKRKVFEDRNPRVFWTKKSPDKLDTMTSAACRGGREV